MELRQLNYFVMVAKTLNFSEAARRLYITQGTLSQQISSLEAELGHQLFDRTSRKVVLSDAGEQLLPLAEKTIEDSKRCSQKMKDMQKELTGTLKVGVTYCFDEFIIGTLKEFNKMHPKVKLVIVKKTAGTLLNLLRAEKLDLVLAFRPVGGYEDLDLSPMFSTTPMVIIRKDHPLAKCKEISVSQLRNYGLILPGESQNARRSFDDFVDIDTSDMDVRMEIDEPELLLDAVRATGHVGVLAPVGIEDKLHTTVGVPLLAVPITELKEPMLCCTHSLKKAIPKASRDAFIEVLRDNIKVLGDPDYLCFD